MKFRHIAMLTLAGLCVPAVMHGQALATGESHPELLATPEQPGTDEPAAPVAKPSASTPVVATAPAATTSSSATIASAPAMNMGSASDPNVEEHSTDNTDYGMVTRVPHRPGELPEGTIFRTHLNEAISTSTSRKGDPFTARLVHDVLEDGRVVIPVGSIVTGRVTKVTPDTMRRYQGHAKLRLRPDEIILPDGSKLIVHAQVIQTSDYSNTQTDGEGTIVSRDNTKKNWEIAGATTGGGAATGAVIGGPVGAVVGTAVGAGVGGAHYMMGHPVASLPESSTVVFQLTEPMAITPLHE